MLSSAALVGLCGVMAQAQSNKPMQTLQMPAMPEPARITLSSKTTALIVLDYVEEICAVQPKCKSQMLPAMVPFIDRVRKAGLVVAYGTRAQNMAHWLKEVAPAEGDIKIVNTAQDRFYNTDLDKLLKAKGITTLILAGWKISGSVTFTSVAFGTNFNILAGAAIDSTGTMTVSCSNFGAGQNSKAVVCVALGNGVLTVENFEQAWERAKIDQMDKGGFAARAAIEMIALRRTLMAP